MKTFYKTYDNCASVEVRSDSGSKLHAYLFITFDRLATGNFPKSFVCHNIDLSPIKYMQFVRSMVNTPLHIICERCVFDETFSIPELDFELANS